ncbi:MAG TPA: dihydroxy-acid dehydratase [Trebonia sp.]|nr:dihydroxy-acid dehydratase [Trebonia sp.]
MTDRRLRSNFTPGSTPWAMRRAQWTALGLTEADLEKPKIAIVNSSSQLASCFSHLDQIVGPLKAAITAAGGVAFEVRTAAPSDAITSAGAAGQYILPSRDLIASDIEVAVEGALLDGMVCLASCDKTTPGQLMAAGRLNIPTIVVGCGYQPSGVYRGEPVDFEDIFRFAGHVNAGRMTVDELGEMSRCAVTGPGVCAGMGTANSMHLAAEALGMALPGTTPVLALGPAMWDAVAAAGARIVELVAEDVRPRSILAPAAFRNAVIAILAVSGSVNCLKHLQAIAVEAGCDVDVYRLFEELAPTVPLLTDVKPNGDTQITAFEAAGGTLGLLRQLAPLLELSAGTVAGGTLGDAIDAASLVAAPESAADAPALAGLVVDEAVIRPLDAPVATHPGIVVMRGSLAPDGAVLKRTVADDAPLIFRGPAKVVRSRDEGVAAARAGRFSAGDVVVLTGLGLRGSPGMGLTSALMFAIDGAGLSRSVAVITDGQMSGLVNGGLVIAEVSPEGAAGGPLGLVRDGDVISIDVDARTVDLEVEPGELAARRAAVPPLAAPTGCGWLSVYARSVAPLGSGATLGAGGG